LEITLTLFRQILVMVLLAATGMLCTKRGILTVDMAKGLCNLLLVVVIPVLMIHLFQTERTPEKLRGFWMALIISFAVHLGCILISTLLIPRRPGQNDRYKVERMAAVFPNCAFMGYPLLLITVGEVGTFYGMAFNVAFSVFNWTWTVAALGGKKEISARKILLSPGILGAAVGMALFLLSIPLPDVLYTFTGYIYSLNTPLAMLTTGVILSQVKPVSIVSDPYIYRVVFLRNILQPGLLLLVLYLAGAGSWFQGSRLVAVTMVICASCSSAMSSIQFPARYGGDSIHGARLVAMSTAAALVTLPLIATVANQIL